MMALGLVFIPQTNGMDVVLSGAAILFTFVFGVTSELRNETLGCSKQ